METILFYFFIVIGGVLLFLYLFFAIIVYYCIHSTVKTGFVKLLEPTLSPEENIRFQGVNGWADDNGFYHVGFFQIPFIPAIAGWENPEKSSFLIQYFYPQNLNNVGIYFEFYTLFDNNLILETGNNRDGILLPVPAGYYMQQFPTGREIWQAHKHPNNHPMLNALLNLPMACKELEKIWELHNDSIRYLTEYGGVRLTPFHPNLTWDDVASTDPAVETQSTAFEVFQNSCVYNICHYIRSLPFYPLRGFYWYFYRRNFWVNKTIQEQVEMGRLFLPQHLPSGYEKYFVMWSPENNQKTLNN
ncbi:MAG: hypothetical protein LBP59_09180 [Planctomycetaceae bacterium]|jgi:hypothetical protein|nr:hypothetical protein [Planctomycetaceae bacterium]